MAVMRVTGPSTWTSPTVAEPGDTAGSSRTVAAVVPFGNILGKGELVLGLELPLRVLAEEQPERDGRSVPRGAEDVRKLGGVNQLPRPDKLLTGASALLLTVLGEGDISIPRALPGNRPLGLSFSNATRPVSKRRRTSSCQELCVVSP